MELLDLLVSSNCSNEWSSFAERIKLQKSFGLGFINLQHEEISQNVTHLWRQKCSVKLGTRPICFTAVQYCCSVEPSKNQLALSLCKTVVINYNLSNQGYDKLFFNVQNLAVWWFDSTAVTYCIAVKLNINTFQALIRALLQKWKGFSDIFLCM